MRLALTTCIVGLAVLTAAAPQPEKQETGVAIPINKRSSFLNADKTVNIEALQAHVASVKAKILRGFDNYERNTGTPHPSAPRGNQRRDNGTGAVPMTDYQNDLWYGDISVGTPPSTFTVQFDTGSSDLFLPGPNCTEGCHGHAIYNPSSSKTAANLDESFSLGFGDLSWVEVNTYTDRVTIGGLTALNQTLGAATTYSSGFGESNFPPDGLLGMAFQSESVYGASPVFQTILSEGWKGEPAFSFKLATSGSELYLGGANSQLYTGEFIYVPVTQEAYWQVNMGGIVGNGKTILSDIGSIIDTGTSLVVGKSSEVARLHEALGGSNASDTYGRGYWSFPCDSFPSINFVFGGISFPISSAFLNLGPVSGSNTCVSGIVENLNDDSFWIVGDVFLANVYTKFDLGNSRVGFARLA